MSGPHKNRKRKLEVLQTPLGQAPPAEFTFEGVKLKLDHTGRGDGVAHYVYRAVSGGWRISFTDRQFCAGIELTPSARSRAVLTGGTMFRGGMRE